MSGRQRLDASLLRDKHNSGHSTKKILELAGIADMLSSESEEEYDDTGDDDITNQNWQTVGNTKRGRGRDGQEHGSWPTATGGENQGWMAKGTRHKSGNRTRQKSNGNVTPNNQRTPRGDGGKYGHSTGNGRSVPHKKQNSGNKTTGRGGGTGEVQVDWSQVLQERLSLLTGLSPPAGKVGGASPQPSSSNGNLQSLKADHDAENIDWPESLSGQYELKFACDICYPKTGHGIGGRKLQNLAHHCTQNLLLTKSRGKNGDWARIRPRPFNFPHNYVLCLDFKAGKPCSHKLGEEKCNFPNTVEEKHFWELDREGKINIAVIMGRGIGGTATDEVDDVRNPRYDAITERTNHSWNTQAVQGNYSLDTQTESSHLYCEVCDIMCNSIKQIDQHCASKKHMEILYAKQNEKCAPPKQVGKLMTKQNECLQTRQPSTEDSDATWLYCETCDIMCNSIKQKIQHCASKKHKENMASGPGRMNNDP